MFLFSRFSLLFPLPLRGCSIPTWPYRKTLARCSPHPWVFDEFSLTVVPPPFIYKMRKKCFLDH